MTYEFREGTTPLLVSIPHAGLGIPEPIAARMTDKARELGDTDWHVPELYDFLHAMGASVLAATQSRYVVDLNRPPDGASLYPGQATTGLAPTTTFDGEPLYQKGEEPDAREIDIRVDLYWHPYHTKLLDELEHLKRQYGYALLWDAHSIRSRVPRLFDGGLPDMNFGTNEGRSCDTKLTKRILAVAEDVTEFTHVLNGRFKGGFITRNYGNPDLDIHAVQLELSQATYMDETPPYNFRPEKADRIRPTLQLLLETMLAWKPSG
ncbi:N-formylglutamate deformylase [Hwanghaeella grinnelliae]|uniref:N-formylglutamate deformylase n=1 Tax=Hwanghaeella grinnelliae TaxID=2500179 RepID=A0A437QVU1_9PROT|nr:N-formylglutamate deformylase [Hwanghaeella grinnelliae]RVU38589.1 N-formylglutamate deformylase [Hwanghaeella grinnelliae]